MDPEAPIIRLDNFQSSWKEIGQMKNPARLKFTTVLSHNEVFIYGGKCEKLKGKKNKNKGILYIILNLPPTRSEDYNIT